MHKLFDKLFNGSDTREWSKLSNLIEDRNHRFVRRIKMAERKHTWRRMKTGKTLGPDKIPIEFWKYLDDMGVGWLTNIFKKILNVTKMPGEWRRSTLILIYKNTGDIQNCKNSHAIKLMSCTIKIMGESDWI